MGTPMSYQTHICSTLWHASGRQGLHAPSAVAASSTVAESVQCGWELTSIIISHLRTVLAAHVRAAVIILSSVHHIMMLRLGNMQLKHL